jgi:hypothetical protein
MREKCMQILGFETHEEHDDVLCCVLNALNSGYAFGCAVVTSTHELTDLQELQFYVDSSSESATELERQLKIGRIALALCPMLHVGQGHVHFDIHISKPYCDDPNLRCYVLRLVVAQLRPW